MDIERLHSSVRAVQRGEADVMAGYSDQSHQIRSWRKRLDVTPDSYRRSVRSPMVASFGRSCEEAPSFYL
jgi:AraC-like DNA-binding protein